MMTTEEPRHSRHAFTPLTRDSPLSPSMKGPHSSASSNSRGRPRPVKSEWDKFERVDRSSWWKSEIKETPIPGSYDTPDFIADMNKNPVKNSYRFKSDGRKRQPWIMREGKLLLPGAYNHHDIHYNLEKSLNSYGFKNADRFAKNQLTEGLVDKNLDLAPGQYNVEDYLGIDREKLPSKHMAFRSRTKRLPSKEFLPRDGPEPGKYELVDIKSAPVINSSFRSRAPRFITSHTRVPGPGAYEKTYQSPMPATIAKMGRQHGLFFSSTFYT